MNVILYKYLKEYKEININWKEGKRKISFKIPIVSCLTLINQLILNLKGHLLSITKNEFDYEKLDFDK